MIQFLLDYWPVTLPAYILVGFGIWYLLYGLTYRMNGGRHSVFYGFWEELLWHLPGGLAKRTDYIRKMVGRGTEDRSISGYLGKYSYEEIREQNLYEEVAKTTLGTSLTFWSEIVFYVLWPIWIALWVASGIVVYAMEAWRIFGRSFQWNPPD